MPPRHEGAPLGLRNDDADRIAWQMDEVVFEGLMAGRLDFDELEVHPLRRVNGPLGIDLPRHAALPQASCQRRPAGTRALPLPS